MHGLVLGPGDGADSLDWLRHVPTWKADVLPLDEPWRGSAPARAMLVVMGEGEVVEDELLDASACASPAGVARLLAEAVHEVAREAGGYPRRLRVRDGAVAGLLAAELDAHGVDVRVSAMRETERAIRELAALLDEPEVARDLGPVDGWSGLAAEDSSAFAAAAARFWRARPWERLDEREALLARWRGRDSAVVVTPPLGHGHVITVFTHAPDYRDPFGQPEHPVWGVKLTRRERLPRILRREAEPSLWTVADDGTCCMVLEDAADALPSGDSLRYLAAMLSAVAALAESRAPARRGLCFHDGESGVELRLESDVHRTPWPAMRRARPACASGPAADPEAALRPARLGAVERARARRFAARLRAAGHPGWSTARHAANVEAWARFLARVARVPSEAATERDLRVFLFDRYPRTTRADELRARSVPGSLGRYFRYLAEHEGIAYPWAPAVLRERPAFRDRMETAPLGRDLEEAREWRAELFADLDDRVMLPAPGFPGEHTGEAPPASPRVAALARELGRRWLLWRDEAVREGIADPAALRAALVRRQRAWERDPHPAHGASPLRVAADAEAGGDEGPRGR